MYTVFEVVLNIKRVPRSCSNPLICNHLKFLSSQYFRLQCLCMRPPYRYRCSSVWRYLHIDYFEVQVLHDLLSAGWLLQNLLGSYLA